MHTSPSIPPFYVAAFPQGGGSISAEVHIRRFHFLQFVLHRLCGILLWSYNGDGDGAVLMCQRTITAPPLPTACEPVFAAPSSTVLRPYLDAMSARSREEVGSLTFKPHVRIVNFSPVLPLQLSASELVTTVLTASRAQISAAAIHVSASGRRCWCCMRGGRALMLAVSTDAALHVSCRCPCWRGKILRTCSPRSETRLS